MGVSIVELNVGFGADLDVEGAYQYADCVCWKKWRQHQKMQKPMPAYKNKTAQTQK